MLLIYCYNVLTVEKFKFALIFIVVVGALGLLGYWAVSTIEPGNAHFYKEKQLELEAENEDLQKEILDLKNQLALLEEEKEATPAPIEPTPAKPTPTTPKPTTSSKYQTLIIELQKLVDDNIFMKVGSKGTRVGTVQEFLNIYNKTSNKVDNDYGAGLKTAVTDFQKDVGTTADGETGPATYKKMIEWLKKQ